MAKVNKKLQKLWLPILLIFIGGLFKFQTSLISNAGAESNLSKSSANYLYLPILSRDYPPVLVDDIFLYPGSYGYLDVQVGGALTPTTNMAVYTTSIQVFIYPKYSGLLGGTGVYTPYFHATLPGQPNPFDGSIYTNYLPSDIPYTITTNIRSIEMTSTELFADIGSMITFSPSLSVMPTPNPFDNNIVHIGDIHNTGSSTLKDPIVIMCNEPVPCHSIGYKPLWIHGSILPGQHLTFTVAHASERSISGNYIYWPLDFFAAQAKIEQ